MKWPWVSRGLFAHTVALLTEAKAERDRALSALAEERARYASLTERALQMRQAGFSAPEPLPAGPVPAEPGLPAVVAKALAQRSEPHTPERRAMSGRARDWLAAGASENEVAKLILHGEQVAL